ncbi:alpha/beta fold hydrolase [Micromonospora sp. NPDC003776]
MSPAAPRRPPARRPPRSTGHRNTRGGRADAPPRREPYTVEQEIDDLGAVLAHTGARRVIGHSYGAFVVLRAALRLPLEQVVAYDAPLCLAGHGLPTHYLDPAEEAVRAGDIPRAMALVGAGVNPQDAASRLPLGVQTAICRLFLRTPIGRTMGALLPMTLRETRQIQAHEAPAEEYAGIAAEVLLACGAKAAPWYAEVNEMLAAVLPRARTLQVPRCGHNGIAVAPPRLVDPIATFLASPTGSERPAPA